MVPSWSKIFLFVDDWILSLSVWYLSLLMVTVNIMEKPQGCPWQSSGWEECFKCRGQKFDPWWGIKIPCATWCSQKTEETTVPPPPKKMEFFLQRILYFLIQIMRESGQKFFLIKTFFLAVLCGIQDLSSPTRN